MLHPIVNDADFKRFSEACQELYRSGLTLENYARRAFAFIEKLVPTEFLAFGSLDLKTKELDIGFNQTVPDFVPAMQAFGRIMGNYELFCWDPKVNGGKPFCRSDCFTRREFKQLDVYREVYRLLGIDNHCAVHVPAGPGEIAFFGLERNGGPDFSREEREMLTLAQAHLGNARELVQTRVALAERGAVPAFLIRHGLTVREADVLVWLAEGKSNEEIAILLGLQVYTVKGYVKTIFQKTGVPNRLAAALWALRVSKREEARISEEDLDFVKVPVSSGRRAPDGTVTVY